MGVCAKTLVGGAAGAMARLHVVAVIPALVADTLALAMQVTLKNVLAAHAAASEPGACLHADMKIKQKGKFNDSPNYKRTYHYRGQIVSGPVSVRFVSVKPCTCGANVALVYSCQCQASFPEGEAV